MIEDLISKQQQLMVEIPYTVRPDALVKMAAGAQS